MTEARRLHLHHRQGRCLLPRLHPHHHHRHHRTGRHRLTPPPTIAYSHRRTGSGDRAASARSCVITLLAPPGVAGAPGVRIGDLVELLLQIAQQFQHAVERRTAGGLPTNLISAS